MRTCVDFHSHILPGIDDGSRSIAESLKMLQMEVEQGIQHVVATPHFYPSHTTQERFLRKREVALEALREAMTEQPNLPKISLGAEVYYFPGISESDALSELTIQGKKFLLLEMPHTTWTSTMYREMEDIYARRGITPIIAHVDRYIGPLQTFGIPKRLVELPVLVQANAEFFTNRYTARMALRMLREDRIHLLGSDCHNLTSRAPNLGTALTKITEKLGEDAIKRIQAYESMVFAPDASL